MTMSTDVLLLDHWLRNRDAEAFRELVTRHAGLAYGTARRILRDPSAAEDVAQDCFLKLVEAPRPVRNLPAWLHRVASRRALEVLRSERRRRAAEARATRPERGADPEPIWDEVEPLVDEAIEGLPDDLRIPIVLHFIEGKTHEAIAGQVGVAKATIAYRMARGIEGIRSFLKKRGIAVTSALLAGWLAERLAEAAPPALIASLGKLALVGPAMARAGSPEGGADPASVPALPAAGTAISLKAIISITAGVALLGVAVAVGIWLNETGSARQIAEPSPKHDAGPARVAREAEPGPPAKKETPAPAPVAEAPKPDLLAIAGRVVDSDGNPIPGAEVFLAIHPAGGRLGGLTRRLDPDWWSRSRWRSAVAGAEGEFQFAEIPPAGEITVAAFHEGHAGGTWRHRFEGGKRPGDIDLKLPEGKTLRGTVVGQDDRPIADAVVSVYEAWNPGDKAFGGGMDATDAAGRFRIGVPSEAESCTVQVNSDSRGRDFFIGLALTGEEILLKMKQPATVGGRVAWADGTPAKGVVVILRGEIPEPEISVSYGGIRSQLHLEGIPDSEGTYEIAGVPPGLVFEPAVIAAGKDRLKGLLQPLTPRGPTRFRLEVGEAKTWDVSLARPIIVRGTIRTERAGTPVHGVSMGVRKDGKTNTWDYFPETDESGAFQAFIGTGPGRYVLYAVPSLPDDGAGDLIAERFGQTLDLKGGEEVEVDLRVFEPVVLPVRVIDADGKPVKTIRTQVQLALPGGRHWSTDTTKVLDADGRGSLVYHFAIEELALKVSAEFPQGPLSDARTFRPSSGTTLPEETFVLERTRALTAVLLGADGSPASEARVTIDATYADGKTDRFSTSTDRQGRFSVEGWLRTAAVVLEIESGGAVEGSWKSESIDPGVEPLDLGGVRIAPDTPVQGEKEEPMSALRQPLAAALTAMLVCSPAISASADSPAPAGPAEGMSRLVEDIRASGVKKVAVVSVKGALKPEERVSLLESGAKAGLQILLAEIDLGSASDPPAELAKLQASQAEAVLPLGDPRAVQGILKKLRDICFARPALLYETDENGKSRLTKKGVLPVIETVLGEKRPSGTDLLFLKDGEKLAGTVLNATIRMRTKYVQQLGFEARLLAGISFDAKADAQTIFTVNGNRLTGSIDDPAIAFKPSSGAQVAIPREKLRKIIFRLRENELAGVSRNHVIVLASGDLLTGLVLNKIFTVKTLETKDRTSVTVPVDVKRIRQAALANWGWERMVTEMRLKDPDGVISGTFEDEEIEIDLDCGPVVKIHQKRIDDILFQRGYGEALPEYDRGGPPASAGTCRVDVDAVRWFPGTVPATPVVSEGRATDDGGARVKKRTKRSRAGVRVKDPPHPLRVTGYYGQYHLIGKKDGLFVDALCQVQRPACTMDHTMVLTEDFNER